MKPERNHFIHEIVKYENDRSGGRYDTSSLLQLGKPDFKNQVKDSAEVFRTREVNHGDDFIITLSNQGFPDSVSDAIARASAIKETLNPIPRMHVISPTIIGERNQRSYAFWPRKIPISSNKFLRKAQIISINPRVLEWISNVGGSTKATIESYDTLQSRYYKPLVFLLDDGNMPSFIKQAAGATLDSLESSSFKPVSVAQHGDFWHGNILLEKPWPLSLRSTPSFYVIDWGGSTTQGYPFIDALRYMMSVTRHESTMLRNLVKYHHESGLPFRDIVRYACAHVGYLGMNRGEFPLERYRASAGALIQKASILLSEFRD